MTTSISVQGDHSLSGAQRSIAIPSSSRDRYAVVQQEVDLGVKAFSENDAELAIVFFQSAIEKLDERQPFYDHLLHNLLLSYKLGIEQTLQSGETLVARSILERALRFDLLGEMALNVEFRKSFAGVFDSLGLVFLRHGRPSDGVRCCRKAISIHPSPGFRINLENALRASGEAAVRSDFSTADSSDDLGRHLFIACVPKSGSTFLKNVLISITGYRDAFMVGTPEQFGQDLYLPTLDSVASVDTVTQQHCRASDTNVHLMQAYGIRPVVLVRNIFDCVISLLDFYNGGAFSNSFFRADYLSLDEETRIDLLIDNLVPWYFEFVASWTMVEKQRRLEIFWLSYEDVIDDKPEAVRKILDFYGLSAPMRGVADRITEIETQKRATRFNKGVAGRGKSRLSDTQKNRIQSYARYYPTTDFSRIGL